jgi:hypothetical protein
MPISPAYITVPVRYKNSLGAVTQAGTATVQLVYADPGANGLTSSTVDISGYTGFVQNSGGAFTPATATLAAVLTNVTAPTYAWTITGATPATATTASVVITPTSSATSVTATLTVNGSNLSSPISKLVTMPVAYNGPPGQAGDNGVMSAFPTIYIWTTSDTPPTRPSTSSTYTWSTGAYTAPTSWYTSAPSNTTPGSYLWSITVPLNEPATVVTSTLDWSNTTYPIRGIAYNGTNGAPGVGVNGTRTAILDVYQWSVLAPTTFPSGSSTYTWATGQFTAPATLNGWSLTPPAAVLGQVLWIARTLYADNNTTATTTITWTASTANPVGASGINGNPGSPGAAGDNGSRTAFLEVYQWSATVPTTFPSGNSTYTWADGSFTAPGTPNSWSLTPGASTPGYTLYACSVRYADTATTATTSIAWTTTTAYIVGAAGSNGAPGGPGAAGSNGAATFVITRSANDSSAPTDAEVSALLGRNPVAGDICTVSYNTANNAVVYRYVTSWALFQTYITGSLIVQNTITADKIAAATITGTQIAANTVTASNINSNNLTIKDSSGTVIFGAGTKLNTPYIVVGAATNSNADGANSTVYVPTVGATTATYNTTNIVNITTTGAPLIAWYIIDLTFQLSNTSCAYLVVNAAPVLDGTVYGWAGGGTPYTNDYVPVIRFSSSSAGAAISVPMLFRQTTIASGAHNFAAQIQVTCWDSSGAAVPFQTSSYITTQVSVVALENKL